MSLGTKLESCSFLLPHTCTASKGFWAQALGVGDFYYEVSRLSRLPRTRFSPQELENEARLTSNPSFPFHILTRSFGENSEAVRQSPEQKARV